MSFLKKLGRSIGIGTERHAANQRYRGVQKYVREQEARDESYLAQLTKLHEGAFINPHLTQLLSPAFDSRLVAQGAEAVDQGVSSVKSALGTSGARNRIGRAQLHRQAFQADVAGAAQKAGIASAHDVRRTQLGAQVEQQRSQGLADIESIRKNLDDSRARMLSSEKIKRDVDTDRASAMSLGRGLQLGAMGLGGVFGGMAGAQTAGQVAGQVTGGMNPAAIFQGLGSGILPQGNYGANPLLTYVLTGMMGGGMQMNGGRQHDRGLDLPYRTQEQLT